MKSVKGYYIKAIMYTIISILFAMSCYIIIINLKHMNSLNEKVKVSDIDDNYNKYKDNINLIDEQLKKIDSSNKNHSALTKTLSNMQKGGVFRLVPKSELTYIDLYNLNDFFIEELINNSWVHNLKDLDISKKYQNTMTLLINNSKYLNSVFTSNSLILYEDNLDNKITDNYHFILNNYLMYSDVILNICNEIGGVYE